MCFTNLFGGGSSAPKTNTPPATTPVRTVTNTVTNNTQTPAPITPPPAAAASSVQGDVIRDGEMTDKQDTRAKRKGRNALRIRLDAGNTGGGTGINIPRA